MKCFESIARISATLPPEPTHGAALPATLRPEDSPWALRAAGTRFAWDCGPIGATQYNKVTVSGPKGRIVNDSGGDSDGIAMTELEIQAQHTDAESEDAVSIVFS